MAPSTYASEAVLFAERVTVVEPALVTRDVVVPELRYGEAVDRPLTTRLVLLRSHSLWYSTCANCQRQQHAVLCVLFSGALHTDCFNLAAAPLRESGGIFHIGQGLLKRVERQPFGTLFSQPSELRTRAGKQKNRLSVEKGFFSCLLLRKTGSAPSYPDYPSTRESRDHVTFCDGNTSLF